jgi:hypothetical protein
MLRVMNPTRIRFAIIIAAPLLIIMWFLWWSRTSVQANRTFTLLKSAIENGRAGSVMDCIHPDYDIRKEWPNQLGEDAADLVNNNTMRMLVSRALTGLFQIQNADPFTFNYTIAAIEPQDDDTVAVTVTIALSTKSGQQPLTFTPALINQRFILAKDGWWPTLYVRSHPAFSVAY